MIWKMNYAWPYLALPLSGCDSTSSINRIGKVKTYQTICQNERFLHAAALLVETDDVSDSVADVLEELLYGVKGDDINCARYTLFTKEKKVLR